MPRRIALQVSQAASRLLRGGYLKSPPAWYEVVVRNPPVPPPPRSTAERPAFDLPSSSSSSFSKDPASLFSRRRGFSEKNLRSARPRPQPIVYPEDKLRRQFFRDHPWEAYREKNLIEGATVRDEEWEKRGLVGKGWTELRQRTRKPNAEDVIAFALSLHEHHSLSLGHAYHYALSHFYALRSEYETSLRAAQLEATAYGAVWKRGEIERGFLKEKEQLNTWAKAVDGAALASSSVQQQLQIQAGGAPKQSPTAIPFSRGKLYALGATAAAMGQRTSPPPAESASAGPPPSAGGGLFGGEVGDDFLGLSSMLDKTPRS